MLIYLGGVLIFVGLVFTLGAKLPFVKLGHLPGDVSYKSKHFQFYFPWVTCLLISAVLSLIMWLISRR